MPRFILLTRIPTEAQHACKVHIEVSYIVSMRDLVLGGGGGAVVQLSTGSVSSYLESPEQIIALIAKAGAA